MFGMLFFFFFFFFFLRMFGMQGRSDGDSHGCVALAGEEGLIVASDCLTVVQTTKNLNELVDDIKNMATAFLACSF